MYRTSRCEGGYCALWTLGCMSENTTAGSLEGIFLIGQNIGGQKCRKYCLLPKFLSADTIKLYENHIKLVLKQNFGGQKCRNFKMVPKILSAEILSDKVFPNSENHTGFNIILFPSVPNSIRI